MPGAAVVVRGLRHAFATPLQLDVLDGLDLDVAPGAHVAVAGPSGAGRTTLLSVLGGFQAPRAALSSSTAPASAGWRATTWPPRRTTGGVVFRHPAPSGP